MRVLPTLSVQLADISQHSGPVYLNKVTAADDVPHGRRFVEPRTAD